MKQRDKKTADRGPQTAAALDRAEEILFEIRTLRAEIFVLEGNAERKIAEIRGRYRAEITSRAQNMSRIEKELMALMKEQKAEVFGDTDKVELIHGFLFHSLGSKVIIPRGALAEIETRGWKEAIKVAKSVDRAVVKKWSDERLDAIGARRESIETFSYEVRPDGLRKEI